MGGFLFMLLLAVAGFSHMPRFFVKTTKKTPTVLNFTAGVLYFWRWIVLRNVKYSCQILSIANTTCSRPSSSSAMLFGVSSEKDFVVVWTFASMPTLPGVPLLGGVT